MNVTELIGRLLGLENTTEIGRADVSLSAPWAHNAPVWLILICVGLLAAVVVFYVRYQHLRKARSRIVLTLIRASLLCLLVLILAQPVLTLRSTSQLRPLLWMLFDGSDSMAINDNLPEAERTRLADSVNLISAGGNTGSEASQVQPARIDYVKAMLAQKDANLLDRLQEKFRVRAFVFDKAEGVRALTEGEDPIDPAKLAADLTSDGEVTALGTAFADLARRQSTSNLAGVVVFSDFNQNAGLPAIESAKRLGVSVYPVGVGPTTAMDLAVDLQCPPLMKKDERYPLVATVRQDGLSGETVTVKFYSRPMGGAEATAPWKLIDQQNLRLTDASQAVETAYNPTETGRFAFKAEVDPFPDEVIQENNEASSEARVHDDFMRLMYVEYEPTWEWRFVKEVFHRDKLIGTRGFRTFLRSADPKVRQTNDLFLPTMSPPRSDFFANDVILLGDMPAAAISPRFCEMAVEFVDKLGGGLVVVAGPRFGPAQLANTPLADILPVKIDQNARARSRQSFRLQRTAESAQYDFMQLDAPGPANENAWNNLGPIDWYQPVERLHPMATALAVHPTDKCKDDPSTPMPIVAIRPYGRGEVVYIGFNEMWRLRRLYGEKYYRQFWGQLIHRLASRHALGSQKRFVVRTDRRQYRANEHVFLTVEAYDANFRPLSEDKIPGRKLSADWILPEGSVSSPASVRPLSIAQLREGLFEVRFPVLAGGEHRVRVKDPISQETSEVRFQVKSVSAERERAVRNTALQQALADNTQGKSYDLTTVGRLPDEINLVAKTETNVHVIPLWNTWPVFMLVMFCMLGEWLGRKWVNLP